MTYNTIGVFFKGKKKVIILKNLHCASRHTGKLKTGEFFISPNFAAPTLNWLCRLPVEAKMVTYGKFSLFLDTCLRVEITILLKEAFEWLNYS